jgi:hypothetical protein
MAMNLNGFELPYEVAEKITEVYLKRQAAWMQEELKQEPLFEEDKVELLKDLTAVRRVIWWLTGDFNYDDTGS